MKIELIAFDSMGVRSMCTYVETKDARIIIDPGVALAPRRFGLPPHRIEIERMEIFAKKITEKALNADVIIITHYHYDHHDVGDVIPLDIYNNKMVIVKDPENNINRSQGDFRAPLFLGIIKERAKCIEIADGRSFLIGNTKIEFSKAVYHGSSNLLGYVVEVMIDENGDKLIHTSDVQGPIFDDQMEFLIKNKPRILIVDGPMIYMLGYRYSYEHLASSIKNLESILNNGIEELIIDHHMLRDLNYVQIMNKLKEKFPNSKILTAAEYMGMQVDLLEARRKELFKKEPMLIEEGNKIKNMEGNDG
ncbi:MAG: MBL fold metallo-hydrolase [Candidatus Verstraetearchaeota archaeon]|nr:MBL fold metallo-hydrolase [Candidatus Verstraetearchaeota archaeon]